MARKRRKLPGHYCWCCDRRRPNERFSGSGHARHLCRDCARLGKEELEFRQAERDLERCLGPTGMIRRKRRVQFNSFLEHPNPRIRERAEAIRKEHEEFRELLEEDERRLEEWCPGADGESDDLGYACLDPGSVPF